jgi:hypothetical protein
VSARTLPPAVVAASVVVLALALATDAPAALRGPLAMWFLLACPGLALVPLVRLHDTLAAVALIVALSVALDIVVALAMMYAGLWSPAGIFAVLALISLAGGALQLREPAESES